MQGSGAQATAGRIDLTHIVPLQDGVVITVGRPVSGHIVE